MPPYPRKLINEGENVVLDLKPHWFFFWKHIVVGIVFLVVFVLWLGPANGTSWLGWPLGIGLLVFAAFVVEKYLVWTYTHFVLTDRRVISRSGIVSKRGTEIPLERINNIDFHQNILLRMIGAGDLDIESAGKDGQSHFDNVRHPDMVQQEVYRQMEANARRQASWSGEAAAAGGARRADRDPGARVAGHRGPDHEACGLARPGPHHSRGVRGEEGRAARADVRVVSLVPSATETLVALGVIPVACTRFCEQDGIPTVGGTKDPHIDEIVALAPDLVVVNDEENRHRGRRSADRRGPRAPLDVTALGHRRRSRGLGARRAGGRDRRPGLRSGTLAGVARGRAAAPTRARRRPHLAPTLDDHDGRHLRGVGPRPARLERAWSATRPTAIRRISLGELGAVGPGVVLLPDEPYPFADRHIAEVGCWRPRCPRCAGGRPATSSGGGFAPRMRSRACRRRTGSGSTFVGMQRTLFDSDHELFRDSVRAFIAKELVPHSEEWEHAGIVDREVFAKAGAQGFLGIAVPEEYGGGGVAGLPLQRRDRRGDPARGRERRGPRLDAAQRHLPALLPHPVHRRAEGPVDPRDLLGRAHHRDRDDRARHRVGPRLA